MNRVEYKNSLKKQVVLGVGTFSCICFLGVFIYPVNTLIKVSIFSVVAITITFLSLMLIRRYCKSAKCTSCNAELFDVIEATKTNSVTFNYCPSCGDKLEI